MGPVSSKSTENHGLFGSVCSVVDVELTRHQAVLMVSERFAVEVRSVGGA